MLKLADAVGDVNNSREAAQALLQFRSIAGETFDRTLKLAHDLSASGFGGITESAKAMGTALKNPAQGLQALENAGLRFSAQQKALITDLIETGHAAEAQRAVLDIVASQIGGAGGAKSNTLTGAYTSLSDAMQPGRESWGQTIVSATHLVSIIQTLAGAMNAVNNFELSPSASFALRVLSGAPLLGPAATFARMVLPAQNASKLPNAADAEQSATGINIQEMLRRRDAVDAVIAALNREADTLSKTELQRKIDVELLRAETTADSAAGKAIAERVRGNVQLEEANKKRAEAERRAASEAERATELLSRRDLQSCQQLETVQLEIALIGASIAKQTEFRANLEAVHQLQQDALRTHSQLNTAEYERIKGINAQIGALASLGEALRESQSLASDFAKGFAHDLMAGKSAAEALNNALDRLVSRLADLMIDKAIGSLFSSGLSSLFTPSALGNVFDHGGLVPFARGGVITQPIIFPMARGMGLAGERGPEAIMPLERTLDGRLGVVASGGNSTIHNTSFETSINVTMPAGSTKEDGDAVAKRIGRVIDDRVNKALLNQRRYGTAGGGLV